MSSVCVVIMESDGCQGLEWVGSLPVGYPPNVGRPGHQATDWNIATTRGLGKQQCRALWTLHLELGWQLGGNAETETGRTLGKRSLREHSLLVLDLSDCSWAVMTFLCASELGIGYARSFTRKIWHDPLHDVKVTV